MHPSSRFKFRIAKSSIDGLGLYALENIPGRRKIGEMTGEIISVQKGIELSKLSQRLFIVEFDTRRALHGTDTTCEMRYINHSCSPNTYVRVIYPRVEFYSLRPLKKGEELTANYGETHHEGKLPCKCGQPGCKGFL
ncbi:MAG: hypothetical protein RL220_50 [Bacteroidota bacterium]